MKQARWNGSDDPGDDLSRSVVRTTEALPIEQSTWEGVTDAHPDLVRSVHRRLIAVSLFGRHVHHNESTGGTPYERVVIGSRTLSEVEGREQEHARKQYVGRDLLEAHRDVLPGFRWTGWQPGQWSRQVEDDGLTAGAIALFKADLARPVAGLRRPFDLWTGDRVASPYGLSGGATRDERRDLARAVGEARAERALCEEQAALIDVLNGVPPGVIERVVKSNAAHAAGEALAVTATAGTRSSLRHGLRAAMDVRQVQYQPWSPYGPSRGRRTVRVFPAVYPSVVSLWRQVRKAYMRDCIDCELRGAHFAIAAWRWSVRSALDLLDRDGTPWPHLLAVVGGTHRATPAEAKDALKRAVYSVVYGMSENGVRWNLGLDLSFPASAAFLDDPVVRDLLDRRDTALAEICAAGGGRDCFGVWYPVRGHLDADAECRSALAAVMQAEELRLLLPVVEDAARVASHGRPQYHLVAWQHDGFALKVRYGADAVGRRVAAAVQREADRLGVPTGLDVEVL